MTSFGRKITRVAFLVSGFVLFALGLFGALFGLVAIIDPIGTQMANDLDPLGTPPSLVESITITGLYAALAILGGWLFKRGQRAFRDAT